MRSLIFVPGIRRDMLEKARAFPADVIVADLEDSVPPAEKLAAREIVKEMAPVLGYGGQKIMVRINSLDTGLSQAELSDLIGPHLYGISMGKVQSAWDLEEYHRIVSVLEARAGMEPGHLKFIPWVESSAAVIRAYDIATASPRIVGVAFGAEDYTEDMGVQRTDAGDEVYLPRAMVALAARAAGVIALDGPYVRHHDRDGLREDSELALKLGFKGKFAIHPSQIDIINSTFSPRPEEVEYARRVVEAWEQAESVGRGSTSLDGRMIDVPVVKRARNLLAIADAVVSLGNGGGAVRRSPHTG